MASGASVDQAVDRPAVGENAPLFALPSVRGLKNLELPVARA